MSADQGVQKKLLQAALAEIQLLRIKRKHHSSNGNHMLSTEIMHLSGNICFPVTMNGIGYLKKRLEQHGGNKYWHMSDEDTKPNEPLHT